MLLGVIVAALAGCASDAASTDAAGGTSALGGSGGNAVAGSTATAGGAGVSAGGSGALGGTGSAGTPAGGGGAGAGLGGSPGSGGSGNSAGTGGAGSGGAAPGGAGGAGAGGGGPGGAGGMGGGDSSYPCDGTTAGYDAVVTNASGQWVATRGGSNVYSGGDMRAAIQAGIDSLSSGRSAKESVLVMGSGSIPANARVEIASYTVLNVCGTIDVTGSGSGDYAPLYARDRRDIEIPNVKITGSPVYNMFFRGVDNLRLGQVDMRVSSGIGIRIDNHSRSNRADKIDNIALDYAYVEGGRQALETYGVNELTVGTIVARGTTESTLLLNDTTNAEVGTVDAEDAATGTGYAAFRIANRAGRIDNAYPTNIHVGMVRARRGGRGIFCVSESGGLVIDNIDIADTGNNSILLENCYNVTITSPSGSGTVSGGGEIRLAARDEFAITADITIQNLTVTNTRIAESPCATNSTFQNIMLMGSASLNVCQ